jgi:hypothetical protein
VFNSISQTFLGLVKSNSKNCFLEQLINFKNNVYSPLCKSVNTLSNTFSLDKMNSYISFTTSFSTKVCLQSLLIKYYKDFLGSDEENLVVMENRIINFFNTLKYTSLCDIKLSIECEIKDQYCVEQLILELFNISNLNEINLILRKFNFVFAKEIYEYIQINKLILKSFKYYMNDQSFSVSLTGFLNSSQVIDENALYKKISIFLSKFFTFFKKMCNISSSLTLSKLLLDKIRHYLNKKSDFNDFFLFIKFDESKIISLGINLTKLKEKSKLVFKEINKNNYSMNLLGVLFEYCLLIETIDSQYNLPLKMRKIREFAL